MPVPLMLNCVCVCVDDCLRVYSKDQQFAMIQIVAALLHLGNVTFKVDAAGDDIVTTIAAEAKSSLELVSWLLAASIRCASHFQFPCTPPIPFRTRKIQ